MKSNPPSDDAPPNSSQKRARPGKSRIDVLIVERGLAPSREKAQAMLLAGNILVNGQKIEKPGTQIATDSQIEIIGETLRYASRGGLKLEGALEDFGASPGGKSVWTSEAPPEVSPTACCNKEHCAFTPWTSPQTNSPGNCARIPG